MKNKKAYLILFYLCLVITFIIQYISVMKSSKSFIDISLTTQMPELSIILLVIGIIFAILFIKKDINASIICPIVYIIFIITVSLLVNYYFGESFFKYYITYYTKILSIGLLFLIIYTCLCLTKKEKSLKTKNKKLS